MTRATLHGGLARRLVWLGVLNWFDWGVTWAVLVTGLGNELNPVMRWAYMQGPVVALGLKVAGYLMCAALLVAVSRVDPRVALRAAGTANLLYCALAVWHLSGVAVSLWR